MTKKMQSAAIESAQTLRNLLKPGDTAKTILRSVSRSGMMRRISLVIARDNEVIDISWDAAQAMGEPTKQRGAWVQVAGIVMPGCGMDMGFALVYNLSRTLFPDGFEVTGYGRNGDTSGWDNDGGYALKQAWL